MSNKSTVDNLMAELSDRQQTLSLGDRAFNLDKLASDTFDLLVVGGGITGCGIALDASSRGLKVALIEAYDFASGTSSRSSKLIHGGLRYLQQFEFGMVREAAFERHLLTKLAPGLVSFLPFVLPVYGTIKDSFKYRAGLLAYDLVSGRKSGHRHRTLSKTELFELSKLIENKSLKTAYEYADAITDDVRLTIQIAKVAASLGCTLSNYLQFISFSKNGSDITGAIVLDRQTEKEFTIKARQIVTAGGVWTDKLGLPQQSLSIAPSKGSHILLKADRMLPPKAFTMTSPSDRRLVFAVPWYGTVFLGTTETPYKGDPSQPLVTKEDAKYLLETINHQFPSANYGEKDIISSQAGLRPLLKQKGKSLSKTSRKEQILRLSHNLSCVGGGKLTTYRPISARVVDSIFPHLGMPKWAASITSNIPLLSRIAEQPAHNIETSVIHPLTKASPRTYFYQSVKHSETTEDNNPLQCACFHTESQVHYCLKNEMVITIEDFLARRTRTILLDPQNGTVAAEQVSNLMGQTLAWTEEQRLAQLDSYMRFAKQHQINTN